MSRVSEITNELNKLSKGYFSYKTINGKQYCYLQDRVNGKIVSKYIPNDQVEKITEELLNRALLEAELSDILNSGTYLANVSKNANELTGYLMMEDTIVASYEKGQLEYINEKLAPLYIVRTNNLEGYLSLRSIDNTRTNSRLLRKVLGIKDSDNKHISLHAYGATITDNYWFKAKGSKLKYKDISFTSDFYSDLSLSGEVVVFPKKPLLTPELTTPGSYEKCWKLKGNDWWLYKAENKDEIFSELFVSKLAKRLNINTVDYEYDNGYIKTKNFTTKYNFEPMVAIAGEDDSYENVFNALSKLNEDFLYDYIMLMYFDCLVKNVDRHNENIGLLRDKRTGKIISLAPNFDNNISLLSSQSALNLDPSKDGFISLFKTFLKTNKEALNIYKSLKLVEINKKMIKDILDEIEIKVDEKLITDFIINRYKYLKPIK